MKNRGEEKRTQEREGRREVLVFSFQQTIRKIKQDKRIIKKGVHSLTSAKSHSCSSSSRKQRKN
jgi:hypothetical protein